MNPIEKLFVDFPKPQDFAAGYLRHLKSLLDSLDSGEIAAFVQILKDARNRGGRIFFIGNGGSAATASHFANDLGVGIRAWNKPFQAIALTDNQAVLTALANDYGYEDVFLMQLKVQLRPGDVVVAISASGNSPNLLKAVEYANANGAVTVGLTGFDGGKLRKLCRAGIHVPTSKGEYGPVEDVHMILDHLVAAYLAQAHHAEES